MIDDDIRELVERERRPDLGRLEADVWRQEATLRAGQRTTRRVAAWQGVVMAVATIASASAGFAFTVSLAESRQSALMMPGEKLAPSTLLFGLHR
jgi:hypothetical protein